MDETDRSGNGDENLAVGDTPSGSPPFLVYKRRLYVLSKRPPSLRREDGEPRQALEVRAMPGRRLRALAARRPRKAGRARVRPYVKGTYRVYSSRFPHLAPTGRRKQRRRSSRSR